jgi:hypothetical protein
MKKTAHLARCSFLSAVIMSAAMVFAGCQSPKNASDQQAEAAVAPASVPMAAPAVTPAPVDTAPVAVTFPLRIKAGRSDVLKDAAGNTWLPDQGFADGDTAEREDVQIENTTTPALYRSERYGMSAFSVKVPNGKYTVKLHFCETYEGIEGPGQRVFSFNVQGREFKDFDVWVKAGGPRKAYIETVNVDVTGGKLDIGFTSNIENPEINAVEIIPAT